jgi:hypothetical protein
VAGAEALGAVAAMVNSAGAEAQQQEAYTALAKEVGIEYDICQRPFSRCCRLWCRLISSRLISLILRPNHRSLVLHPQEFLMPGAGIARLEGARSVRVLLLQRQWLVPLVDHRIVPEHVAGPLRLPDSPKPTPARTAMSSKSR